MARSNLLRFFFLGGLAFLVVGGLAFQAGDGGRIVAGTFFVIGVCWAGVAVLVGGYYNKQAAKQAAEQELFETGRRATAVVTEVEQTSTYINHMPVFTLTVRVEPEGGDPFVHTRRLITPTSAMPVPGQVVAAAYDPMDRSRVALETRPGLAALPAVVLATRGSGGGGDNIDKLERLARLRDEGVLTEAEFREQKARLLEK